MNKEQYREKVRQAHKSPKKLIKVSKGSYIISVDGVVFNIDKQPNRKWMILCWNNITRSLPTLEQAKNLVLS